MKDEISNLIRSYRKIVSKNPNVSLYEVILCSIYCYGCQKGFVQEEKEKLKFANSLMQFIEKEQRNEIEMLLSQYEFTVLQEMMKSVMTGEARIETDIYDYGDIVSKVAVRLLSLDEKDVLYHMGSGSGRLLANAFVCEKHPPVLIGCEKDKRLNALSSIGLDIINTTKSMVSLIDKDPFTNDIEFTKAFVFPPIGARLKRETNYVSTLFPELAFNQRNSSEWVYVDSLIGRMKCDEAKVMALLPGRVLFNENDKKYRDALLKKGLIESIVELPGGVLPFTHIEMYLILFSKNNREVNLVDAKFLMTTRDKRNLDVDELVEKIVRLTQEKKHLKNSIELLGVNKLMPSSLLLDKLKIENGAVLADLANVFTGSQYTTSVFEKNGMISKEKTGYQILTSGDIDSGIIEWDNLISIRYDSHKFDKYALMKGDVVITSKTSKVKVVVVDRQPEEKVLVTGGMIVVRPNQDKINPTYLKIFFDSEQGTKVLKSIQKGNLIVTINSKDLSMIRVPLIDIDKQRSIANKYNEELNKLIRYKEEIKKIEKTMDEFYTKEVLQEK